MSEHGYTLPVGTRIDNYEIKSILGEGGFGITYKAWDHELGCDVAIKEYLPGDLAYRGKDGQSVMPKSDSTKNDYEYGLDMFVNEAQTLAAFNEPNIVQVKRFLRVNGTAYLVMNYVEGQSLSQHLKQYEKLDENTIKDIFIPLLKGLAVVHESNVLHRDIKPGNIYLRKDGVPVLIDFGAAREALGSHSRSMTAIVTPGYAPFEQYSSRSKPGPAMDLYAIGAAMYRCISGETPIEAPERVDALYAGDEDPLPPAATVGQGRYSQAFLEAVDWMMSPSAKDRPQTINELLNHSGMRGHVQASPAVAPADETTEIIRDSNSVSLSLKSGGSRKLVPVMVLVLLVAGAAGWWALSPGTTGASGTDVSGADLERQKAEEAEILRKAAEVERNRLAREKKRLEAQLAAQQKQAELEKQRILEAQKKSQAEALRKRQLALEAERKRFLDDQRKAEQVRAEAERKRKLELEAERKRLQEERLKAEKARAEVEAEKKRRLALEAERQRLLKEKKKTTVAQAETEDQRRQRLERERQRKEQARKAAEKRKAEERRLALEREKLAAEKRRLEKERLAVEKKRLEAERLRLEAARKRAAAPQLPKRKVVFAVWYDVSNSRRNKLSLPDYSLKVFRHLVSAFKQYTSLKNVVRESHKIAYDLNYEGLSAGASKKMCGKHGADMVLGAYYDLGDAGGGGSGREITYTFYNCKTAKRYEDTYEVERAEGVAGEKFPRSRDMMRAFTKFLKLNIN